MFKKVLKELGFLNEEQVQKIDKLHLDEIADSYVPLSRLEEEREAHKKTRATLDEQSGQIKQLQEANQTTEQLKQQLETMTKKAEEDRQQWETKQNETVKNFELERKKLALSMAIASDDKLSPIDLDYVAGLYDLDTIKLDEKGNKIKSGFVEQHDRILKERPNLFMERGRKGVVKFAGAEPGDGEGGGNDTNTPEQYGRKLAQTVLKRRGLLNTETKED